MSSDVIGFVALITIFLTFIKLITTPNQKLDITKPELWLLAYFMIVIISLCGSTLFHLSLKGFMKTFTYLGFYFSLVQYLKANKSKIPYILGCIGICVGFESIAGFLQNFARVEEISTWQDVSKLNPEEVMTRVYGTLKPYNPNLLGGYFVAGIPALFGLSAYYIADKKYKWSIIWLLMGFLSVITLFLTGCRGSYIGMLVIMALMFAVSAKYLWNNYKKIYLSLIGGVVALMTMAVLLVSSLRARVLSIFAMRQDSSNSFRFNVYHSSVEMFKDNWLLGIGVGNMNFREIYGLYMKTGFDALSAYNIFLEIAVESGIFALIAFVGYLITLVKSGIKHIIKSNDIKTVALVASAVISICAVCIHGLVDTVFFRPQIQFVFWTMAAIISVLTCEQKF
ncbi:MAG: O-antigen ligase family protein [Candidatus Gastranaerophilaceae bacterium]